MNTIMIPSCFFTLHGTQACWMAYEISKRDPFQDAVPCWQAATPYTLTGKRNKPTYHTAGDYKDK